MRHAGDNDVALPGGVFKPDKVVGAGGYCDEIGFAVSIQIGCDDLVAAFETGCDFVRNEVRGAGGPDAEERAER